jgi:hypothetical protein
MHTSLSIHGPRLREARHIAYPKSRKMMWVIGLAKYALVDFWVADLMEGQ